jgi:uroporphyrinogen-III synthase
LRQRGHRIDVVQTYRTTRCLPAAQQLRVAESLLTHAEVLISVSSAKSVEPLVQWLSTQREAQVRWLVNHPVSAQALERAGFRRIMQIQPGLGALMQAVESP